MVRGGFSGIIELSIMVKKGLSGIIITGKGQVV